MSKPIHNPSAFPWSEENNGNPTNYESGMTLRDYFAAKAMQTMVAGQGARMVADRDGRYNETNWAKVVAANAYEFADAMLEERVKTNKS